MENQNINEIYSSAMDEIGKSSTSEKLQELKIKFLAKKSVLMSLLSTLGSLPPEERKEMGQNNILQFPFPPLPREGSEARLPPDRSILREGAEHFRANMPLRLHRQPLPDHK